MFNFIPLSDLMLKSRPSETVVAIDKEKNSITWDTFKTDIAKIAHNISNEQNNAYVLACDDLYNFSIAFMALCSASKHIVIAPNHLPKTLQQISHECGAQILTDEGVQKSTNSNVPDFKFKNIDPEHIFFTLYTSGSTGSPSLITKPLSALEEEAHTAHKLWRNMTEGGAFASSVVHYHAYGLLFQFAWPLCTGIPFINERINYPEILENYKNTPINFISSPAFLSRYSQSPSFMDTVKSLKFVTSAGSPLSKDTARHFEKPIVEIYGSSETGIIATRTPQETEPWSLLPKVELKTDSQSSVLVRSPYTGLDEWCAIQDTIKMSDDGKFELMGRQDRIVKIHEKRVSLEQVEKSCLETKLINEIKALSLGEDAHLGCVAILNDAGNKVVLNEGKAALVNRLKAHLRLSFDSVLLPRKWRFVSEFPQNDMGKVLQSDLLSLFEKHDND